MVGCDGYHQNLVRTGYDYVIPYRVGKLFAYMAQGDGEVISVTKDGIVVAYTNGEQIGVRLGRVFGKAAGLALPHNITTQLKKGDVFKKFDPIAYNTGFFEPDILNPKRIVWKSSFLVTTALFESPITLEDSSSISLELANKLKTVKAEIRDIVVNFDQEIHKLLKEGDKVEPDTILCLIEDALSAQTQSLDESTIDTLRELDSQAPRAKISGKIDSIEVYYNGEIDDMSETLRGLVKVSDKRLQERAEAIGEKGATGLVGDDFRIGNDPLYTDTACIRIYMTADVSTGIGDKGVFSNQLKTVFGDVFDSTETEDGIKIDAIFGQKSESDRIVSSAAIIGSTAVLIELTERRFVDAYYKR